jgi:NADP-dependent 3-hydroxy acid dehydrogenase YdfG
MSSGFKVTGLGQMKDNLEKLKNNVENIPKHQEVTFDKLFNDNFMQEFTKFNSFQEMLDNSGFKVETQEDFKAIPDKEWDDYIKENTKFDSWQDMGQSAQQEYLTNQVKNAFKL